MSDEQESLSSIVGSRFGQAKAETPKPATGEPAKPAEAAPPAAASSPSAPEAEKPAQARDETGKFTKADKAEAPPEKTPEVKPRADVAAIIDERRKRQELEKRLQELTAQQQKPTERPSVFENEDVAIRSRVDEATKPLREMLYNQSIRLARANYKDAYGDAETAFLEAAEKDERLIQGLRESSDPGEYIYMHGMFHKELSGVGGDLLKYREHVTADLTGKLGEKDKQIAALTAEIEALKKAQTELESVPRSLNSTSSGPAPKSGEGDDDDLRSIARFNQRR